MKPRIIYVHGDGVSHWAWSWVVRLKQDLETAGFPTFFETFPDSIEARAEYWLPFLRQHVGVGSDDVLLGWSCGAVASLRIAQEQPLRGLALVAPYYTDLGLESVRRSGFVTQPWDWPRIRKNAASIAMFHSDQDPYITQAEFVNLAERLSAQRFELRGAGHFAELTTFPELTSHLLETYGAERGPSSPEHS